jgi:hypothetical protein
VKPSAAEVDPTLWANLHVGALYVVTQDDEVRPQDHTNADDVYAPIANIPKYVMCRISTSTKRLENGLTSTKVGEGEWGEVYQVKGSGSIIGVVVSVREDIFGSAIYMPDGVIFMHRANELPDKCVVSSAYAYKTFKIFRIGTDTEGDSYDLYLTTKKRWYKNRHNQKSLGFSKE